MRIEVPQLPPVEYSLNWRGHWAERQRAGRIYQSTVFYCCVDARTRALTAGSSFPLIKARLNLTFVFPEQRRRDRDNLLARFKPGLDGIVRSGLVVDDDVEHLDIGDVYVVVDPERAPLTVIDIEEVEQ